MENKNPLNRRELLAHGVTALGTAAGVGTVYGIGLPRSVAASESTGYPRSVTSDAGWRNVKDYGAAGDGLTDDTDAIQAAVDAASVAGGVVFVPAGVYLISAVITVGSDVTLLGDGFGSVIKLADNADSSLITGHATGALTGLVITRLALDGNEANQAATDIPAIRISNFGNNENIMILECRFVNVRNSAIRIGSDAGGYTNRGVYIAGNTMENIGTAERLAHAIFLNWRCPGARIIGNHIRTTGANSNGIWVGNDSGGAVIADNYVENSGDMGIECWQNHNPVTVVGNHIDSTALFGMSLDGCPRSTVAGNIVRNATVIGIEIVESNGSSITGNVVDRCSGRGFSVDKSHQITITACTLRHVGTVGVRLVNGADGVIISSNVIDSPGSYAVEVANATADDLMISSNMILSPGDDALHRSGGTVSRFVVSSNLIRDPSANGLEISDFRDGVVAGNTIVDSTDTNTKRGILVADNSRDVVVSGNRITGFVGAGGVGIEVARTADEVLVVDNNVRGNAKGISSAARNTTIRNNRG